MVDINNIEIYHYYHLGCEPFQNIVRLPKEETFRLAYELAVKNPETTAFYRFADYENYYPLRMKTDALLYDRFIALGGSPVEKHPLSFVLGSNEYLHHWFGDGVAYYLSLADVPSSSVSFTMGDSCAVVSKGGEPEMFTKTQLENSLLNFASIEEYIQEIKKRFSYIEVQLWDDSYCKHAIAVNKIIPATHQSTDE